MDKYDTFWRRFCAGFLDALILMPISFLVNRMINFTDNLLLLVLGTIVFNSIYFVYTVWFHWKTGQTPGKKLMNIRVVDKDELRLLTLEQALKRDSVYILIQMLGTVVIIHQVITQEYSPYHRIASQVLDWFGTAWFLTEVVSMMMNPKSRAVHDFLADSVVIKEEYWKKENQPETT